MVSSEAEYETRVVRSVRGMENRTISKWEKEGWEVVSQATGKVRSEITIRRAKPKSRLRAIAIAGSAAAAALAVVIVIGVISEQRSGNSDEDPSSAAADGPSEQQESSESAAPEEAPTPTEISEPEVSASNDPVMTPEGDAEFGDLLTLRDYCDPSIAEFIEKHHGETVAFDGNVSYMANHESYNTRYDILIEAGEFSETTSGGPAFQFKDVNLTSDLLWTDENPGTLGVGDKLRIVAEVQGEIYPDPENWNCLIYLEPVATAVR
ncbi:hypothetical protein GCM10010922_28230 [Microbacterium sorbitolivorans]|nr:hypothetical protein GCM10010922_28230 [Microbacterium sorbitolivorans]